MRVKWHSQSRNEHSCDQDTREGAHELQLLGKLFAKKGVVSGWIGVQKLWTYPNQKTRPYERNDSPEAIEDYDIGVSYETAYG
jgi:hypothetical protein